MLPVVNLVFPLYNSHPLAGADYQSAIKLFIIIKKNELLAVAGLYLFSLVGIGGFEPPTPALSAQCSNLLSYIPLY